ncbi:MAG: helix-turn-helix transcriptional regulator [Clostridia bacterium]|nr:helix-turn-helix transcriptional regulator [Clostridia bacterium]
MFVDIFNELLDEHNLNRKQFAEQCGIPYTTVVGWTKLERLPDFASLIKIADFFDCSIDYLAERNEQFRTNIYSNATEEKLLANFRSLSKENKNIVLKISENLSKD